MRRAIVLVLLASALAIAIYSYLNQGIVAVILDPDLSPSQKVEHLKRTFHAWGSAGPLFYFLAVVLEVIVAPIPGTLLYAPGGIIFGGFLGGTLTLLGNVVGAGIACGISRSFLSLSLSKHPKLTYYDDLIRRRGFWIVFLLRLNPLTSSDLVSYAAGLTSMPTWKVMLATFLGMLPLCFAQSFLAEKLFVAFPLLVYPFLVVCLAYAILILRVVWAAKRSTRVAHSRQQMNP